MVLCNQHAPYHSSPEDESQKVQLDRGHALDIGYEDIGRLQVRSDPRR